MRSKNSKKTFLKNTSVSDSKQVFLSILFISLISFFIISPQIYQKYIVLGSDSTFHFNRFYDMSMQLKNNTFSYFQTLYGFDSSGRIINALYGYDIAFFHGILLLLTKSWLKFQILSSFLCLLTAGINMYCLSRYLKLNNYLSIIASVLYLTSSAVNYYIRQQAFIGWGAAFVPLIFIPAFYAIKHNKNSIRILMLGGIMGILVSTHVLTAIVVALAILPFYLFSFIKSEEKIKWLLQFVLAIILCLLLSLNTIVSFIDVYSSNNILSPFLFDSMLGESFRLSTSTTNARNDAGIIFSVLFIFQLTFSVLNWKKLNLNEKFINLVGGFFLIMSTPYIPWDLLKDKYSFVSIIQFPSRFSVIAYVLLILGFLITMEKILDKKGEESKKVIISLLMTVSLLSAISINYIMVNNALIWNSEKPTKMGNNTKWLLVKDAEVIRNNFRSSDLTKGLKTISKSSPDYLPIPKEYTSQQVYKELHPYSLYTKEIRDNDLPVEKSILSDGRIQLVWKSEKAAEKVVLPVIVYGHSKIEINDKKVLTEELDVSDIGALKVISKEGENKVTIGYESIFNMKLVLLIKIITVLFCIFYWIANKYFFKKIIR